MKTNSSSDNNNKDIKIDDVIIKELEEIKDKCISELKDKKFSKLIDWLKEQKQDNIALMGFKLWVLGTLKPMIHLKDMSLQLILLNSGSVSLKVSDFSTEIQNYIYDKFKLLCNII